MKSGAEPSFALPNRTLQQRASRESSTEAAGTIIANSRVCFGNLRTSHEDGTLNYHNLLRTSERLISKLVFSSLRPEPFETDGPEP